MTVEDESSMSSGLEKISSLLEVFCSFLSSGLSFFDEIMSKEDEARNVVARVDEARTGCCGPGIWKPEAVAQRRKGRRMDKKLIVSHFNGLLDTIL
jgi:hypothetical protein